IDRNNESNTLPENGFSWLIRVLCSSEQGRDLTPSDRGYFYQRPQGYYYGCCCCCCCCCCSFHLFIFSSFHLSLVWTFSWDDTPFGTRAGVPRSTNTTPSC